MRWGLFQGSSLGNAARDAYARELDGALLPQVAARFRQRLIDYAGRAGEAVPVSEGVPDARGPGAPRQGAARYLADLEWQTGVPSRRPSGASLWPQHFNSAARLREDCAPQRLDDDARRAGAQHASGRPRMPALVYRYRQDPVREDAARALRLDRRPGWAPSACSDARAAQPRRSRSRVSTRAECSRRSWRPAPPVSSSSSQTSGWVWGDAAPRSRVGRELTTEVIECLREGLHRRLGRDRPTTSSRCRSGRCRTRSRRWRFSPGRLAAARAAQGDRRAYATSCSDRIRMPASPGATRNAWSMSSSSASGRVGAGTDDRCRAPGDGALRAISTGW